MAILQIHNLLNIFSSKNTKEAIKQFSFYEENV